MSNELPSELPQDLKERYQVQDKTALAVPSPVPMPSPSVLPKGRKRKTSKKTAQQPATPAVPEFVYPSRRPAVDPLWVGEQAVYEVTYFGAPAGDFTLSIEDYKAIEGRKVYHIRGVAHSSKIFSLFYRLDDMVETFLDYEGLFSHRFHILLDETKQQRDSLEIYDSKKQQTFYWNKWVRPDIPYTETKDFQPMPQFPQDSLSALYYARTVPLPPGATFTFPVVSEGRHWDAVVEVVRREVIDTPLGKVRTVVLKPEMKYQGILKKQGDSYLWMTDDDRRIVVRIEAKVRIGSVIASLKKIELGTRPEAETAESVH